MEEKVLALGIENEHEGDSTLWFDLSDPQLLANYIRENIDLGEAKTFRIQKFTPTEFAALD